MNKLICNILLGGFLILTSGERIDFNKHTFITDNNIVSIYINTPEPGYQTHMDHYLIPLCSIKYVSDDNSSPHLTKEKIEK
jgi:hypothetical protein